MMHSAFLGELLGTMMLIILGDGVVAGVLLKHSKAEGAGWMAITGAWGFAVMCGIFVAIATGSPDAHLNPAVTIAFAVVTGDTSKMATYIPAQLLGGFLGAVIVWLHYLPHWRASDDPGAKLAIFCTGPAIRDLKANVLSEVIGTIVLIVVVAAIGSKAVGSPLALQPGVAPYLVGILVWVIGLSLGGTTGYAINPARDFGPRLAHAILPIAGKGGSDWGYALVPILGPIAGALLGGGFVRVVGI
jgi:glycerol uptake facilitator protein